MVTSQPNNRNIMLKNLVTRSFHTLANPVVVTPATILEAVVSGAINSMKLLIHGTGEPLPGDGEMHYHPTTADLFTGWAPDPVLLGRNNEISVGEDSL